MSSPLPLSVLFGVTLALAFLLLRIEAFTAIHSQSSRQPYYYHYRQQNNQYQRRRHDVNGIVPLFSSISSSNNGDSSSSTSLDSAASASPSTAATFSSSSTPTIINGSSNSAATAAAADSTTLVVLKEFEKKQAELAKRKQTALEQVQKFDSTLQQLEQKKKEYLNGLQLNFQPSLNFRETTLRSVVKSFCWRMIAGLVTLITSLQFSGSLTTALSIVSSDFFSKAFTMFLGERLMDRSSAGRTKGADNVQRSLTKALVWRLFAICNTLTLAIFFSKDWSVAGKIAGTDALTKTFLMFAYERVWAKIQWGKEYLMEFSI